jgi:hypothetical protein
VSAGRPPHLIAPDEVDAWLADSAVRVVTYHNTDRWAADAILRNGVDIDRCRVSTYGQGFYTATQADPFFGEVQLVVAVRLVSPLRGEDGFVGPLVDRMAEQYGAPGVRLTSSMGRIVRRELLRLGYDGIVVEDATGEGVDYVIALEGHAVKVVRP